jgi:hypothetical protein
MRRVICAGLGICTAALVIGFLAPPSASAQQSLNLYIGGATAPSEDSRGVNDVLRNDLNFLAFNLSDFNTVTFGGEYLVGLGNYLDAGLGLGFAHSSVPSVYRSQINSDGSEIEQTLKLRVIPFTATIRFLPLGHHSSVEPYIGAGVGVLNWRYTESGEWVDPTDNSIFRQTFEGSGSEVGPLILGGIRVPLDKVALGFELRHQSAEGKLPTDQGFATSTPNAVPTIDLGGFSYLFSVNFRF